MFLVSVILHHISLLRLLPKSYFKISTFQPNFCAFNLQSAARYCIHLGKFICGSGVATKMQLASNYTQHKCPFQLWR